MAQSPRGLRMSAIALWERNYRWVTKKCVLARFVKASCGSWQHGKTLGVYTQRDARYVSKKVAQTRRVSAWKMIDGEKSVKARLVAKGFEDPDLQEGIVDTPGCVRL